MGRSPRRQHRGFGAKPNVWRGGDSRGTRRSTAALAGKACFNLSLNLPLIVASSVHIMTFSSIKHLEGLKRPAQSR